LVLRSGRVESSAASGALKKQARMISEGGVLSAGAEPVGVAVDVAPEGFAHPVYRSGLALALLFPSPRVAEKDKLVEEPVTAEETVEPISEAPAPAPEEIVTHKEPSMGDPTEPADVEEPAEPTLDEAEQISEVTEPEEVATHEEPSMADPAEPIEAEEPSEPTPIEDPAEPEPIEDPKEPAPPVEEPPQEPGSEPTEPEPPQQEHDHEI
jgi:hypothetical protein